MIINEVRVDAKPAAPTTPSSDGDYGTILTENIDLLRQVKEMAQTNNDLLSKLQVAETKKTEAEKNLEAEKTQHAYPRGYRATRHKIIWLNMIVGLLLVATGPTLWLKWHFDPKILLVSAVGLIWVVVIGCWVNNLADTEWQHERQNHRA